jgi:hypothetical protein
MLEIDVGGVFVPAALVWAAGAFAMSSCIDRVLCRTRFYGLVWHRGLFDIATFVILWGAICAVAYHLVFSGASPR